MAATNAIENLQRAKIASGFGFLNNTAGFDISQTLIPFSAAGSTYGDAFIVGLLNTLLVSAIGIVLATFLGFAVGIARLSKNWIVAKVAMVYVEVIRNIPLLLQLLFWYNAVLGPLAAAAQFARVRRRASSSTRAACSCRGRSSRATPGSIGAALLIGIVGAIVVSPLGEDAAGADRPPVSRRHGRRSRSSSACRSLVWLVLALAGANPITFDMPEKGTFNLRGGMQILPEFVAPARRPRDLHGGLHRRGRARRHPRGLEGPDGGRRLARACGRGRRCASSSSRRPCGSSSRR